MFTKFFLSIFHSFSGNPRIDVAAATAGRTVGSISPRGCLLSPDGSRKLCNANGNSSGYKYGCSGGGASPTFSTQLLWLYLPHCASDSQVSCRIDVQQLHSSGREVDPRPAAHIYRRQPPYLQLFKQIVSLTFIALSDHK